MALERPLSPQEKLRKVRQLLEEGFQGFEASKQAEDELSAVRRASVSCESVFHAFVELANALVVRAGRPEPASHSARIEALRDIGRDDLANLYGQDAFTLHVECYYGQRFGREQEERIRELKAAIERELDKLK